MRTDSFRHFTLHKLAAGVYAAIHKPSGGAIANAGIVDLGGQTLVFDTFMYPSAAHELRAAAEALFGRPVALVVNSHVDQDHVFGNQVFPEATIYATELTRAHFARHDDYLPRELERLGAEIVELEEKRAISSTDAASLAGKQERAHEFRAVTVVPPTCTFTESLWFHGSARRVNVRTHGGGHSVSDAVLYLPTDRILFTGDLVTVKHHPYVGEGNPSQWLEILAQLERLDVDILIPGHGPAGTMADLRAIRCYLADLQALALSGADPTALANSLVPEAYRDWEWPFLFAVNLGCVAGQV